MTDGQLAFIGVLVTALITGGFGYLTARASERRGTRPDTKTLPTGQTLDSNLIPEQLARALHSISEQLSTVMADRDILKSDRDRLVDEHRDAMERIGALESRESLLMAHVEDLKHGVDNGEYPPWPISP